jgi:WD40 repeat protein
MLVSIDIKLSILCAKWTISGKKFGLGSSCRTLSIGFYNIESACWTVAVKEKLAKSPITSLSFHPSSNVVAAGSSDNSVRLVTCNFKKSKN